MAWNWESVSDALANSPRELVRVLNTRMKALEQYVALSETTMPLEGAKVYTTDATVTTLKSYAVPVSTTTHVTGYVVARRTGGTSGTAEDGASYRVEFVAKNDAGTAALIASATVAVIGESQSGWATTVDASGGTIRVRVAGAANNNISWVWTGQSVGVKT